jgi:hypothetical protein
VLLRLRNQNREIAPSIPSFTVKNLACRSSKSDRSRIASRLTPTPSGLPGLIGMGLEQAGAASTAIQNSRIYELIRKRHAVLIIESPTP